MLRQQLASCVGHEQLARIEPVHGHGTSKRLRGRRRELGIRRTSQRPKRAALRNFGKRQNLFDAAIAVRRYDEDWPRKRAVDLGFVNAENDIMMKLALRPVRDELERAELLAHFFEKAPEHQGRSKPVDERIVPHSLRMARTATRASRE